MIFFEKNMINNEKIMKKIKKMLKKVEIKCRIKQKSQSINDWTLKIKQRESDDKVIDLEIEGNILLLLRSCIVGENVDTYEKGSKTKMVNLFDAANYMVQLYSQTVIDDTVDEQKKEYKYHCTATKLGKLLSIAVLLSAVRIGEPIIETKIRIESCGTSIPDLSGFYLGDIIIGLTECKGRILIDELNENAKFDEIYELTEELSAADSDLLKRVFLYFGSYSSKEIGNIIDEFKDDFKFKDKNAEWFDLDKFVSLFVSEDVINSGLAKNEIIEFILKY